MVKVRLTRHGAHKAPFYRIVAADSRKARDGRFLEVIGFYDPVKSPEIIHIKHERLEHWLGVGAQISDTVRSLVKRHRRRSGTSQA